MNRKLKSHSFRAYAALGSAAGAAALALMVTTPAGATTATEIESHRPAGKPPVVLVHGSFVDSSSRNGVVKDLKRSGIAVIAPADPLRGCCTATPRDQRLTTGESEHPARLRREMNRLHRVNEVQRTR
ncbi:hypothetical protein [Streptomyces sp. NBC_01217]|uniref:hypothetical protein n=1 Tax=Streptomyces sp. NBC_01217 TaxID=2903779 RepID=UPI002E14768A|nr:hypothetical protein OG507_36200 [Streptomyces sp. NBC_01217]